MKKARFRMGDQAEIVAINKALNAERQTSLPLGDREGRELMSSTLNIQN